MRTDEFWITNISKMNVGLSDLNVTINAYSTVNLLDKRHYQYTREQIELSLKSGSLYKKRDKIFVRQTAPENQQRKIIPIDTTSAIPSRMRSLVDIKQEHYEELNISDEQFALENADLAEIDSNQSKYKKGE